MLLRIRASISGVDLGVKAGEDHLLNFIVLDQFHHRFAHCNFNCGFDWETVNAAADGRKCDGLELVFAGNGKTGSIAALQQFPLAVIATIPYRADGMDDVRGRESIAPGEFGLAGFAASEESTFVKKIRTSGTMDCAVDSSTAE